MGESRLVTGVQAYVLIVGMWIRSTMAYRLSFALTVLGNFLVTGLDFAAIVIMFWHTDALGGFAVAEVALLYGTAGAALGLADLILGSVERLGRRVRDGTLDTLLVRPVPVLAQVAADRFALRRMGRVTQALLVIVWSWSALDLAWTWERALLLPMTVLCGAAIFGAVFVAGAGFQFLAQDAAEVQNSFTYGGNTMLQYPPTIFARDLVRGVTFIVPLAFVNWLPGLRILGREDPLGLPGWVDFLGPVVAAVCWLLAGLAWRAGLRSYRSTGS